MGDQNPFSLPHFCCLAESSCLKDKPGLCMTMGWEAGGFVLFGLTSISIC